MAEVRRGRPPSLPETVKRHQIATRTTARLRDKLLSAAAESGRSMAQEIELRLEQSFDRERLVDDLRERLSGKKDWRGINR